MKNKSLIARACALTVCALPIFYSYPAKADATTARYEPALRDLWQRGSERFHRQWLIAGPMEASDATGLNASDLKPHAGETLSAAPASPRWVSHTAWTDITELSTIEGRAITPMEPIDRYVFVAAVMTRAQVSDEDVMIGSERPYTAWLNGKEIHSRETAEGFLLDRDRIPVTLNSGDNLVLLRIHETSIGSSQISLRTLPRGTPVASQRELAPIVLSAPPDSLAIQTHFAQEAAASVEVVVQGAGARVVATRRAKRGEVVRFDTKGWRTGAYEIRVRALDATSSSVAKLLPWYHGNAIDAVRALVDAAAAADDDVHGDSVRMLAEMSQDRLGGSIQNASAAAWRLVHSPLLEFEELMLERRGERGAVRANGFVRLAYMDEVDGSTQFCRAYLPRDYTPQKTWPLITALHGFNPANPDYIDWWTVDERQNPIANQRATIVIEPHGRGNAQYIGIGERDVLRCIDEAKRRFSVDADRVYLTGESMGGHGTWHIASRNPDVFAAAAPVYGGWDFRVTSVSGPSMAREPLNALDAYSIDRASSFASAENLLHVPLLVVHGDADAAVLVENSRHAVRMLQRWGYNIRYHEMPGWGHEDLGQRLAIADWLLSHTRVTAPRTLRLRSADLAAASAYWLNIRAFERPGEVIRVIAQVLEPGVLRVDSTNVASFAVDLPADLRAQNDRLQVHWNGELHEVLLRDGRGTVEFENAVTPRTKRAGLEGPLHAVLDTPFVVVIGTTSTDPRMRELIQARADSLARQWRDWQKQPLRMVRDTELTAEDEKKYSLMLLGNAESNAITQRYAKNLPFEVSESRIAISGREWSSKDAVLQMIYPSPATRDRYVYVIAPTSTAGMYFVNPQLVNFRVGFPVTAFDWIIQDGRRAPSGTMNPMDTFVAAGIFDAQWRYQETATIERDRESASKWTLRRLPPNGFAPSPATLQALTGHYEVFPGVIVAFRVEDGVLVVDAPGGRTIRLTPESEFVYVDAMTGNTAEFMRDGQGKINGVSVDNDGGVFHAKRMAAP
jgi:predicted esterase